MKKKSNRYKGGVLGFFAEFRWLFGAIAGVVVAIVMKPEANPVELGFLGLSLWLHVFLGTMSAFLVVMTLEAIGTKSSSDGRENL